MSIDVGTNCRFEKEDRDICARILVKKSNSRLFCPAAGIRAHGVEG